MSASDRYADWVAVDWGTSQLRAWAMRTGNPDPVAEGTSDAGMGRLAPDGFEPALLSLIEPWLGGGVMPVMACGMVGARQGWTEAPYAAAPCDPRELTPVPAPVSDPRLNVHILPGVRQDTPADVMRGEETQVAGFLVSEPNFDGILCLPGTHTKWVQISAGEIVSFRTFMTGELFALLSERSVLRHSVGDGWDGAEFAEAVSAAMSRPEALAGRLFSIRAESLLADLSSAASAARLSGLLIGAELAAARPYWLGQQVVILGDGGLATHCRDALAAQAVPARLLPVASLTRIGLASAHFKLHGAGD